MELIDKKIETIRRQIKLKSDENANQNTIDILQNELNLVREDRLQL